MKKFVHVINLRNLGGIEMLFKQYLEAQSTQEDIEHHVILDRNSIHPVIRERLEQLTIPIKYIKLWANWKIPFYYDYRSRYLIKTIKPDKVILWACYKPVLSALERYWDKIDFVYYDHGTVANPQWTKRWAYLNTRVSHTVLCGNAMSRMFDIKYPNPRNPSRMVPNGLVSKINQHIEPKKLNPHQIIIGIPARLRNGKGHALLFHAMKALKDDNIPVQLLVAGEGREEQRLVSFVDELCLQDKIHFLGFVENMASFYNKIDFMILPSLTESFGLVAIEAMRYGCIPIVPRINEFPFFIKDNINGICITPRLQLSQLSLFNEPMPSAQFDLYDIERDCITAPKGLHPEDIAKSIKCLINYPDKFHQMSQAAITYSETRPDFNAYVRNLNNAFLEAHD